MKTCDQRGKDRFCRGFFPVANTMINSTNVKSNMLLKNK